eukprot:5099853-Pleurochrysis_carterae.AAC.6
MSPSISLPISPHLGRSTVATYPPPAVGQRLATTPRSDVTSGCVRSSAVKAAITSATAPRRTQPSWQLSNSLAGMCCAVVIILSKAAAAAPPLQSIAVACGTNASSQSDAAKAPTCSGRSYHTRRTEVSEYVRGSSSCEAATQGHAHLWNKVLELVDQNAQLGVGWNITVALQSADFKAGVYPMHWD